MENPCISGFRVRRFAASRNDEGEFFSSLLGTAFAPGRPSVADQVREVLVQGGGVGAAALVGGQDEIGGEQTHDLPGVWVAASQRQLHATATGVFKQLRLLVHRGLKSDGVPGGGQFRAALTACATT